jgi:hypothetical protein
VTSTPRHSEAAFETVIEHHLLGHGYVAVSRDGFDRERAVRYESEKVGAHGRYAEIILKPTNSEYPPVVLENAEDGAVKIIAEARPRSAGSRRVSASSDLHARRDRAWRGQVFGRRCSGEREHGAHVLFREARARHGRGSRALRVRARAANRGLAGADCRVSCDALLVGHPVSRGRNISLETSGHRPFQPAGAQQEPAPPGESPG